MIKERVFDSEKDKKLHKKITDRLRQKRLINDKDDMDDLADFYIRQIVNMYIVAGLIEEERRFFKKEMNKAL